MSKEGANEAGNGGMRTSTVLTCSFVELQVLKRKDWRNVINTNPGFLEVLENVAKTRLKYSENMGKLKKMHYNHKSIHRGSIQLESMTNDVMNQDWGSHKEDGKPGFKAAVDAVVAVKGLARKTS